MNDVPAGPNGAPVPGRDAPEGKPPPGTYGGQAPPADWRQWARLTIWAVVAIIALIFIFENRESVQLNFVFFTATVPVFVALLVAFVAGALLGGSGMWWARRRRERRRSDG